MERRHYEKTYFYGDNFHLRLFGTRSLSATSASTVFTPQPAISGFNINDNSLISVQNINSAVGINADMLFISGSSTFDATVAQAIRTNFLDRNKPVVLMVESVATVRTMLAACGIDTNATYSLTDWNGTAPVYQFVDIPGDPILHGPFAANPGGRYWGNDGIGSWVLWFTSQANKNNVIMYSNMNNYTAPNRTTTPPAGETTATNYGGGTTRRDVMNSAFLANLIAWGIQRRTTQ